MFYAECNKCNGKMEYARKNAAVRAARNGIVCKSCKAKDRPMLTRSCPGCEKSLNYKTIGDFNRAVKKNSFCPTCAKRVQHKKEFYVECVKCDSKKYYKWEKTANSVENYICRECKKKEEEGRIYKRNCSECGKEKLYKNKYLYNSSVSKYEEVICKSCQSKGEFYSGKERKCPSCSKILNYWSVGACTRANKLNNLCKSCSLKSKKIAPSQKCFNAMIKANTGRIHSEGEKKKRSFTLMKKYKNNSYLQSKDYINKMLSIGKINLIHGKTPHQWASENDIPKTAIYKWLSINQDPSLNAILEFCNNYTQNISFLENIISKEFDLEFYNKKINDNLNYRPDFKLNKSTYLNVDGLYWHSELIKDKKYHFDMRKSYEAFGLRIFQFRGDEVRTKINILKSMANNSLGKIENRVGARKCLIKKVSTEKARAFLNENHIKGYMNSNHIGLYHKEELISIMSYRVIKSKKYIKIDRFCSKANYNIMGGFSKLLKHIERANPNLLIHYWVDLRYGTGNFLLNFDFNIEKETLGWEWTDFKTTYNRLKCRANMDDRGLSEKEHAEELGWVKIYDAGQRLYIKS